MHNNPIRAIRVYDRLLNPAEAELWINVVLDQPATDVEIRGRLMGPRCRYSTTVEVAYPLRPRPAATTAADARGLRVVIPEPSFWDPESPFYYEGPVGLWRNGECIQEQRLRHGFRVVNLAGSGLRCNSRPIQLRGVRVAELTEPDAQQLRAGGCNLLIASVCEASIPLWDLGDRFGFFVIGQLSDEEDHPDLLETLAAHPSCLAWILPRGQRRSPGDTRQNLQVRIGPYEVGTSLASLEDDNRFEFSEEEVILCTHLPLRS